MLIAHGYTYVTTCIAKRSLLITWTILRYVRSAFDAGGIMCVVHNRISKSPVGQFSE